jgi:hypothetical protein
MPSHLATALLSALLALTAAPASAIDYSLSGFGTVGYARSDQSFAYQRFIDDRGTFKRDSVFGGQLDARFSPQWSATVQAKVAPAEDHDQRWQSAVSWAFVSWRPSNDWLFRLGKLRVPLYLTSENLDVGATFDPVRMPAEMYSISPSNDFTGASFNKSWSLDNGNDLSLDGFWGKSKLHWRFFLRDGVPGFLPGSPPLQASGPLFVGIKTEAWGLAATYRQDDNLFRVGANQTYTEREDGATFPLTFPTFSYFGNTLYKVDGRLPLGPALDSKSKFAAQVYTLGVDLNLGHDYRLVSEYARRVVSEIKIGPDTEGAYATVLKRLGAWTPYVTYARLLSKPGSRQLYQGLNGVNLATNLPLATLINASQRAAADGVPAYDQYSLALGASYALSPTSKLKGELMRVHIGEMSSFIDQPAGSSGIGRQGFNVLSLSYSFVF